MPLLRLFGSLRRLCHPLALLLLATSPLLALAQSGMRDLPLGGNDGRGDSVLPLYVAGHPQAQATVILLPGGDAGIGRITDGEPGSGNFLVRSREMFREAGFNVVIAFRASDLKELNYRYRAGPAHMGELEKVVDFAAREFGKPVWLVGTSLGTISSAAAAIALGPKLAGLVLTASITHRVHGGVQNQELGRIQVPVLVVHHLRDACWACVPDEARRMAIGFRSASVSKFVMVEGGSNPQGDPCQARHWHGFIGYEKETVKLITDWMLKPQA
jgi:hypothetical protein